MRKCWLRASMPALFENIFFSLLSLVLTLDIIVFVVLGIDTCVLTDCSDLKSYSLKYRIRACNIMRVSSNSETRRGSILRICVLITFENPSNYEKKIYTARAKSLLPILASLFIFLRQFSPCSS